jgi:hypothetical protein
MPLVTLTVRTPTSSDFKGKVLDADDFVLIEILWSLGPAPENMMVASKETSWGNWAFAGGRILHT